MQYVVHKGEITWVTVTSRIGFSFGNIMLRLAVLLFVDSIMQFYSLQGDYQISTQTIKE